MSATRKTLHFKGAPPYKPGDVLESPIIEDNGTVHHFTGTAVVDRTEHVTGNDTKPEGESMVTVDFFYQVD